MAKHMWALVALLVVIFVIDSCGGGGGGGTTTVPTVPNDAATIMDAAKSLSNGTVIEVGIYRAIDDTINLHDGTTVHLAPGEAKNFVARAWAWLLQPDGTYRREEITMIPGMRFSWCLKGLDEDNAARTINLESTLAQITVADSDLPPGGKYDLSVRAEIAPADLVGYVNGRLAAARAQQSISGGGSDNDDLLWAGAGFLLALAICPSDSAGIILATDAGITPPPPTVTLNISGPAEAEVGDMITIQVASNCPEGWEASWAGGSKSGCGDGSFTITMPSANLVVIVSDGCGNTKSHTVHLKTVNPPVNKPPVAILTVNPTSGNAPLTVHADGSGSYDPDGDIVKYEWFFYGGGGHADVGGITMDNVYDTPGDYSVWLRVTDDDGATAMSATGVTVTVNAPPVDPYQGATLFITPQNPTLNVGMGDEQQFICRIYAADGLTELPIPSGATIVWSSTASGAINPNTGYFYSALAGIGSFRVSVTITWTNHQLTGDTPVVVQ